MALDPSTAYAEATLTGGPDGVLLPDPRVSVAASARLCQVLNTTSAAIRFLLQASAAGSAAPWRFPASRELTVPTQELGQAAFDVEVIDAIRYRSTKSAQGDCIAILTEPLSAPACVEVRDMRGNLAERLP